MYICLYVLSHCCFVIDLSLVCLCAVCNMIMCFHTALQKHSTAKFKLHVTLCHCSMFFSGPLIFLVSLLLCNFCLPESVVACNHFLVLVAVYLCVLLGLSLVISVYLTVLPLSCLSRDHIHTWGAGSLDVDSGMNSTAPWVRR